MEVFRSEKPKSNRRGSEHLLNFVEDAAEEMNHPVYGDLGKDKQDKQDKQNDSVKHVKNAKDSAFSTFACTNIVQCPACTHGCKQLYQCKSFKCMSVYDRYKLVRHNRLCFNCLMPNHTVSNCQSDMLDSCTEGRRLTALGRSKAAAQRLQGPSQRTSSAARTKQARVRWRGPSH